MKRVFALALAVFMMFAVALTVGAAQSPDAPKYISISVHVVGNGTTASQPVKMDLNNPEPVTLTADEKGGKFDHWDIKGEYTIVSGSLTDRVLVIMPKTNIDATAVFSGGTSNGDQNTSDTSPKTGDMSVFVFGTMMMAAMFGIAALKKIKG